MEEESTKEIVIKALETKVITCETEKLIISSDNKMLKSEMNELKAVSKNFKQRGEVAERKVNRRLGRRSCQEKSYC